jgi:alpha-glucosidase (family GH31 glycosyl hydrolase)
MNEPSVSDSEESTMPKENIHYDVDGTKILHRDVHNMYGVMMAMASFEGVLLRD